MSIDTREIGEKSGARKKTLMSLIAKVIGILANSDSFRIAITLES